MKKFLISLALIVPFVTGCASIDTNISINDDKSAEVVSSLTYAGNLGNDNSIEALTIVNNYKNFLDSEYNVKTDFNNETSTITASKSVKNLGKDDLNLSSLGFESNLKSGKFIDLNKNFIISSYNIDMVYDYDKLHNKVKVTNNNPAKKIDSGLTPEYLQKYGDLDALEPNAFDGDDAFDANMDESTKALTSTPANDSKETVKDDAIHDFTPVLKIKVSGLASYNNADSSLGNVYIWKLKSAGPTEIKLQYVRYSGVAITIVLLFGILLFVILAKRIFKHESQKRIDNVDNIV